MTLSEAKKLAASYGYTLRKEDGEYIAYPKGTSNEHPSAIFETDVEACLNTIRMDTMHERNNVVFKALAQDAAEKMKRLRSI